ncbi:MAG: methyltransferase [Candidatus Kryptoniota bacterium]
MKVGYFQKIRLRLENAIESIGQSYRKYSIVRASLIWLPWVGSSIDQLLNSPILRFTEQPPWNNFDKLVREIEPFDLLLLNTVRNQPEGSQENANLEHETLLKGYFTKTAVKLEDFLKTIKKRTYLGTLSSTSGSPTMSVEVNKKFTSIKYILGDHIEKFRDPQLLWDCHCRTPLISEFEKDPVIFTWADCPIHKLGDLGDTIRDRFRKTLIQFKYDGLSFIWQQSDEFWPPSRDAFEMLKDLEADGIFSKPHNSVVDVGCGTGILGISIAAKNHSIKKLKMTDWLLTPLVFSAVNWYRNIGKGNDQDISLAAALGMSWFSKDSKEFVDVAVCNPPYLPIPDKFRNLKVSSTVAGTDLLQEFIIESSAIASTSYVSFSHLAIPEAKAAAEKCGRNLIPVGITRDIPFRLPQAFGNVDYIRWLLNDRGLRYEPKSRHRLWHRLTTYKIVG